MILTIRHATRYRYDAPVGYALQQLRLTPKSRNHHSVLDWQVGIDGGRTEAEYEDQHANRVTLVSVERGATDVTIVAEGRIETSESGGIVGQHGGYAPLWLFRRETDLTRPGERIAALLDENADLSGGDDAIAMLHRLSAIVRERVDYREGSTSTVTSAEDALESGAGVCQDQSHVFIAAARRLGHPARYVGGYLCMDDRVDQDAGHAWAEVHVDGLGWTGFDVSNGISPDERYVRVATGLDYSEAAPVAGLRIGNAEETMDVTLQVQQ